MKALLICPAERPAVPMLQGALPLVMLPFLGRSLLEYWLEHIAALGASHVNVLATGKPELFRALVGNGARWGLKAELIPAPCELTPAAARSKYREPSENDWLATPDDVALLDHFPGLPQYPLFKSYADWFAGLLEFMPHAAGPTRIGMRELKPGVWVGMFTRISPTAQLRAPCWIGERVRIGSHSVVGPMAVIEDRALIESDCEISASAVETQTFIGKCTEIKSSIAWGDSLLNWKTGSLVTVPDPFLMCALGRPTLSPKPSGWLAQLTTRCARGKQDLQQLWKRLPIYKNR